MKSQTTALTQGTEKERDKLLSLKDVGVSFYSYRGVVKALQNVNLDVYHGESIGLVGETGCGKSTLGFSIVGLIPHPGKIDKGKILLEGEDIVGKKGDELRELRRKKLAVIFQDPTASLNPVFRVGDQISEAIELSKGIKKEPAMKLAMEMLSAVGMANPSKVAQQYPHELSGGMKQRVVMAIALAKSPLLLIADEPTSSLDVTIQAQILDLIMNLTRAGHMSMILITHNMGVVAQSCDRVAVMYAGNVVEVGPVKTVFTQPKHPYTIGLLRCATMGASRDRLRVIEGAVPDLINVPQGCCFMSRCSSRMPKCAGSSPTLTEIEPGHFVSCYLYPLKEAQS